MGLAACITTRNRPQELDACLRALWNSTVKPQAVIVSDDSPDSTVQQQNQNVVRQYPQTTYILGPQAGVCANRNNAVNAVTNSDLVAFVDDDICVEPDFIEQAMKRYRQLASQDRDRTILSGISRDQYGHEMVSTRLSFRGYFQAANVPEAVVIHAAVFPRKFFCQEQWDENIFFGYEDAELCLRALRLNHRIIHCPELRVSHMRSGIGPLLVSKIGNLTDYEIFIEAARLYVGIKRYKWLYPNSIKLIVFISIYFFHIIPFLLSRKALGALSKILEYACLNHAWNKPWPAQK